MVDFGIFLFKTKNNSGRIKSTGNIPSGNAGVGVRIVKLIGLPEGATGAGSYRIWSFHDALEGVEQSVLHPVGSQYNVLLIFVIGPFVFTVLPLGLMYSASKLPDTALETVNPPYTGVPELNDVCCVPQVPELYVFATGTTTLKLTLPVTAPGWTVLSVATIDHDPATPVLGIVYPVLSQIKAPELIVFVVFTVDPCS